MIGIGMAKQARAGRMRRTLIATAVVGVDGGLQQEGKLDSGWEFRLPTEVEWEYACRAETTTAYCAGDGEQALEKVGWYASNTQYAPSDSKEWLKSLPVIGRFFGRKSRLLFRSGPYRKCKAVGAKAENAFGLQDMHGNVWELCEGDVTDQLSEFDFSGRSGLLYDLRDDAAFMRVMRGGSRLTGADRCRSAARAWGFFGAIPGQKFTGSLDGVIGCSDAYTGFRVCLVPVSDSPGRIE